jgi:hypothetical protein
MANYVTADRNILQQKDIGRHQLTGPSPQKNFKIGIKLDITQAG